MRIIKRDEISTSTTPAGEVMTELVEVITDQQRALEQRDTLRSDLERDLSGRNIKRLERRVKALTLELNSAAGAVASAEVAAHAAGVQEGIEKGIRQSRVAAEEMLHSLRDLLAEAHLQRQELVANSGEQVVELATSMARLLVGEVFHLRPETLTELIERLLDEYANAAPFTISLNPLDLEMLKRAGFMDRLSEIRAKLVEAPEIPRHQCRVEMAQGLVELGEQQLGFIKSALFEQLEVAK
jgi:flagellar assembly protein FliH